MNTKTDGFEKQQQKLSFFLLGPSDDEAVEKASENRTATCEDSGSKPAVTKKRKQVCKFSSYVEHKDHNAQGNIVPLSFIKGTDFITLCLICLCNKFA